MTVRSDIDAGEPRTRTLLRPQGAPTEGREGEQQGGAHDQQQQQRHRRRDPAVPPVISQRRLAGAKPEG